MAEHRHVDEEVDVRYGADVGRGFDRHVVFEGMMKPALARVYNYALGGATNFEADRTLANRILKIIPGYRDFARANRAFLRRATQHLTTAGIDQFLDLGSGLLSPGALHEVAHGMNPHSHVVYVDNDPIVTAHLRLLLEDDARIGVLDADLCDVDEILDHPVTERILDLTRPVGLVVVAVLHCVTDREHPASVLGRYHARLPAGSSLAASHASGDSLGNAVTAAGITDFANAGIALVSRTRSEFCNLLGPWKPYTDGVVPLHQWRPDDLTLAGQTESLGYAVMATSTRGERND